MSAVLSFIRKNKKKLILILIVIILIIMNLPNKKYGILLEADMLCIYNGNELVTTVADPAYMLDTFKDTVGIGIVDASGLGISRLSMREMYRLEFIKDDKVISRIKVLTPKNQKAVDKIDHKQAGENWKELNGQYVILKENNKYFWFGDEFFENLSQILNES